jgi:rubrerythrin
MMMREMITMTLLDYGRRLEAVEARLKPRCPVCNESDIRMALINDAGEMFSESRPRRCPLCGHVSTRGRTIVLEGDDTEDA